MNFMTVILLFQKSEDKIIGDDIEDPNAYR